jgi:hypothetical protein
VTSTISAAARGEPERSEALLCTAALAESGYTTAGEGVRSHGVAPGVAEPDLAGERPGPRAQLRSRVDALPAAVMLPRYACRQ